MDLGSLLKSDTQSVVNQLLLHLKSSYNKVFTGLSILANKADTAITDIPNSEQMVSTASFRRLVFYMKWSEVNSCGVLLSPEGFFLFKKSSHREGR